MKKTATTIAIMTLILISTAYGQERRRPTRQIGNPFGLGGTVSAGINQTPNQVQRAKRKSPTSTGDQPEMQITNSQKQSLGDTATHEVGHKGKRRNGQVRPNPTGDGTTQHFRKSGTSGQNNRSRTPQQDTTNQPSFIKLGDIKGEAINSQQPNAAKYDGIDGESNDARTKKPNGRRN